MISIEASGCHNGRTNGYKAYFVTFFWYYRSTFSHDRSSNASTMFQVRISSIYYRVSVSFSYIPFYELTIFL
jgi:hypothetical protein